MMVTALPCALFSARTTCLAECSASSAFSGAISSPAVARASSTVVTLRPSTRMSWPATTMTTVSRGILSVCDAGSLTALLVLSTCHTEMPDWRALGHIVLKLRQRHGSDASALRITLPPELPAPLHPVVEEVRQSLLADLPKMLDAAVPIRKLFQQTPAFMGRYFWLNSGLAEVDQHERSASATWKKVTDGNDDEGALLTLFLCVAAGSPPKTLLTDRTAGTLIRKIRKSGLNPELATQYIQAHAPVAYQADYLKLWHGFLDEATATLTRDVDDGIQSALALLRRECHVKAS